MITRIRHYSLIFMLKYNLPNVTNVTCQSLKSMIMNDSIMLSSSMVGYSACLQFIEINFDRASKFRQDFQMFQHTVWLLG